MRKGMIAVALLLSLTACTGDYRVEDDGDQENRHVVVQVVEVDGKPINCVIYDDDRYEQGGISCDFG